MFSIIFYKKHTVSNQLSMIKQQGFTLLELIFTIAIVALLLGLAVPSFVTTIRENRAATITNELLTALNTARSEAVRRSAQVVLCKSANTSEEDDEDVPVPNCTTSGGYNQGWIIFVDSDEDGVRDAAEILVQVFQGMPDSVTAPGAGNLVNLVNFRADGSTPRNGNITICLPDAFERKVIVSTTGRPRTEKTTTVCS